MAWTLRPEAPVSMTVSPSYAASRSTRCENLGDVRSWPSPIVLWTTGRAAGVTVLSLRGAGRDGLGEVGGLQLGGVTWVADRRRRTRRGSAGLLNDVGQFVGKQPTAIRTGCAAGSGRRPSRYVIRTCRRAPGSTWRSGPPRCRCAPGRGQSCARDGPPCCARMDVSRDVPAVPSTRSTEAGTPLPPSGLRGVCGTVHRRVSRVISVIAGSGRAVRSRRSAGSGPGATPAGRQERERLWQ